MPDFRPGTLSYRSSRGCSFVNPRQPLDPSMRLRAFGPIQPMHEPGFLARLFGRR